MDSDDHFGPHRANAFDFTILFEQSILSLLPTGLFLLLVPLRLFLLRNNEKVSKIGTLLWLKLAAAGCYACLQIALVVLWSRSKPTKTAIAESVLGVVESVALASLILVEHRSSRKPSKLISGYLAVTVILDIALVRTFWIRSMWAIAAVFTASFAFKIVLLIFEEKPKLSTGEKIPETSSGVVSRSFFWWLNNLFLQGHRGILETEDLQAIDSKFDTNHVTGPLEEQWEKHPKTGQLSLLKCTFLAYKWQFMAGILPRLLRSGFNFAQPFLIQSIIVFVGRKETSVQISSGLIGATLLIYLGLAICGAWYKHLSFQMVTMYRGGLVSLIFKKTLKLKTTAVKDSAPVTLMTTDVETVVAAGSSIHDMWANLLELPVGIYLLYRQVGHPSLLVLVPTLITTILSGVISPAMEPATVRWNEMVQRRVGETSSMLDQIKGIKMMGLTDFFIQNVQGLRVQELRVSAKFRWLLVHFTTLAMVSAQVTPIVVILSAIYWSKSDGGLSVAEAFTSLSLVSLVTQPLVMLLVSLMQIAGVVAGCGRIQAFLLLKEQDKMATEDPGDGLTIAVENASFHTDDGTALLTDINLQVPRGSISMVVGKVGSGKSSLLKAIIGENIPSEGTVKSETSPAYCDQVPWLRNTTISKNITGQSELDERWLSIVIRSCALEEDLAQLPHGRETVVGSGGVALSGGQKQRVALARAVYSRSSLLVLDDVFSSLDKTTADTVFQRILGGNGLLRASTVILTTSNVHYLAFANYITVIEDGHITRNQITYVELEPSEKLKTIMPAETPEAVPETIVKIEPKNEIDLARKTGDTECYKIYVRSMGWKVISIVFPASVVGAALEVMPQIWLRIWTEQGEGSKDARYAGGYVGLAMSSMILALLNIDYFLIVGVERSSNNLHEQLLNTVCRAPLHFFTTTESGSILNRFSQDMTLIDMSLPLAFYLTLDLTLRGLVQTGLVASGANYYGAFLPLSFLALYLIQKYYLRTSRQMRLLDLEAKTPLYTQFAEITAGLSTVRSFNWTKELLNESFGMLNTSQKPFYLMFCIQRWLELVLDLFVAGMAVLLVTVALRIPGTTSEGAIGLAMVNLLGLNLTLTTVIDQWTTLETSLGAIARLKAFIGSTPNENKEMETEMPDDWPAGKIEIEEITSSYWYVDQYGETWLNFVSEASQAVLQDVSLVVQPGQKVCLYGRSGSGKSSLVLSILRLLELQSGTIRIDGQDLATMSRQYIRSQILTIPQDPVTLSGTVRKNLDPEELVQADEMLIQALKKTTLWPTIEARGGLDADLSALGFSVGQRQLFCLARALLCHSTIVLLDEPTSSIDRNTDEEVRNTIREVMHGRTIIEVTHRLDHVTDFDIAVVMENGKIVETGEPRELLSRESALKALRG